MQIPPSRVGSSTHLQAPLAGPPRHKAIDQSVPSKFAWAALELFEFTIRFPRPYHLLAISVKRIINDPFGSIDLVIVLIAEMPKAFGNGLKSRPFRLVIKRVVCVCGIDDLTKEDERGIINKVVL